MNGFELYSINDLLNTEGLRPEFRPFVVNDSTAKCLVILRTIIGKTELTNNSSGQTFEQTKNYLENIYAIPGNEFEKLKGYISPELEIEDLTSFFRNPNLIRKNVEFFSRLLNEYCNFFYFQNKQSYTTAFVYIYRILEVISFSFPLIYASQTIDFKHTYGQLKEYFDTNTGKQKGELGFFKSAVKIIFETNPILETSVDIDFSSLNTDIQRIFHSALTAIIDNQILHEDTRQYDKICINFSQVSSFIISLRNRFFHLFNRGDKNLESHEIVDSDLFFSYINEPAISWISTIYVEIIKSLYAFLNRN